MRNQCEPRASWGHPQPRPPSQTRVHGHPRTLKARRCMSKGASPQHLRAAGEDASFSGAWGACWWGAEVCRQLGPTPSVCVCVTVFAGVYMGTQVCVCVCEHSCTNAHHQEKPGQVQLCRDLPLPPTTPPPQSQLRPACSSLQIPVTHPPAPTLSSGTAARGGWQTRGEDGGTGQQGEPTSGQPSLWHCTPNLQHPQSLLPRSGGTGDQAWAPSQTL